MMSHEFQAVQSGELNPKRCAPLESQNDLTRVGQMCLRILIRVEEELFSKAVLPL